MATRSRSAWSGVFPETLCPFMDNFDIDEDGLARYLPWISGYAGVTGIVVNGFTGEITSLRNVERARVIAIAAGNIPKGKKLVSGVCAEGSHDAIDQAAAPRRYRCTNENRTGCCR